MHALPGLYSNKLSSSYMRITIKKKKLKNSS